LRTLPPFLLSGLLLCAPAAAADAVDLPARPGDFWLGGAGVPAVPAPADAAATPLRFSSLAELTEHALRARPETRSAWLGIQAEAARLDAASADNWPTLTAQLSFVQSRSLSSSGIAAPTLHRYGPSLSLAYLIYDFGARAAGIDAQRYQLVASLLNGNRTLQDVIAEVEASYYMLLNVRAQVEALAQLEVSLQASLDAAEARLQGGLVSRADQLRARAALAETQVARLAAERDRSKAETALKQAAGIEQARDVALDWQAVPPAALEAADLLAELLAEAQRQRPDLVALQAVAASARAEAERARAARWPSLSLAGSTGRSFFLEDERTPSTSYSVGVNLAVPLFDGGRLAAEARAAARDAERLQAEVEARRGLVAREVAEAYADVRAAQDQREGIAVQYASADESARAAEARYQAGVGSLLELLTAQAALARAQQSAAQADSDWLAAFSRLNHAVGRLPAASDRGLP
jgi:outer membrane protein